MSAAELSAEVPSVVVEARDGVLEMTITRPHVRNAIDRVVAIALAEAMSRLDADPDLAVGLLTGAGGTFSAGMDLAAFLRGERPVVEGRGFAGFVEKPPTKPLVAAVEGWALAGGFEVVLACDVVVASTSARFGLPEPARGLAPRAGGAVRLPRYLPRPVALEMLLTGDPVSAERLHQLGLVNHLVPEGQALGRAREVAARIARNAPLALAAIKQVVDESADWSAAEVFSRQNAAFAHVFASEDATEGARAFVEKRDPVWRGR